MTAQKVFVDGAVALTSFYTGTLCGTFFVKAKAYLRVDVSVRDVGEGQGVGLDYLFGCDNVATVLIAVGPVPWHWVWAR